MTGHARECAVLTAYAESDFLDVVGVDVDGTPLSFGVFQQIPRWWPTAHAGAYDQCIAFLVALQDNTTRLTGDVLHDCWVVQRWTVPGSAWPDPGPRFAEQAATPGTATHNYARRLPDLPALLEGRIPS